jgi:hypothetical protein
MKKNKREPIDIIFEIIELMIMLSVFIGIIYFIGNL